MFQAGIRFILQSMNIRKAIGATALLTLLLLALGDRVACIAQSESQVLTATVVDSSNHPVQNATITFSGPGTVTTRSAKDGTFSIFLSPGLYKVTAQAQGFETTTREGIALADRPLTIQIVLPAADALKVIGHVNVNTVGAINTNPTAVTNVSSSQVIAQGGIGIGRILAEIPGVQI